MCRCDARAPEECRESMTLNHELEIIRDGLPTSGLTYDLATSAWRPEPCSRSARTYVRAVVATAILLFVCAPIFAQIHAEAARTIVLAHPESNAAYVDLPEIARSASDSGTAT